MSITSFFSLKHWRARSQLKRTLSGYGVEEIVISSTLIDGAVEISREHGIYRINVSPEQSPTSVCVGVMLPPAHESVREDYENKYRDWDDDRTAANYHAQMDESSPYSDEKWSKDNPGPTKPAVLFERVPAYATIECVV